MLRVLMTTDTVGGVWTYSLELAKELTLYGVEVALATLGMPLSADQWSAIKQMNRLEVFESCFRLEWMENPWPDVKKAGEWLLHLEKIVRPDLVHLNQFCYGHLPWKSPTIMVAHSDVFSWFWH